MTDIAEFNDWLRKGLGRAVLHLKRHDPEPFRQAVLYACTHNLTYDSQCEDSRGQYLLDLIHAAHGEKYVRDGLFNILTMEPGATEEFDLPQIIEVARAFAENGDAEIKETMYDAVVRAGFEHAGHCYSDLIKLDGLNALVFAAEHFPAPTIDDDDLWQVGALVTALEERDGVEPARAAMDSASREQPRLAQMLEMARAFDAALEREIRESTRPDYPTLKRAIAEKRRFSLYGWGKAASAEELEAAAEDILGETDEDRMFAYLQIFRWRQFPRPIDRLLELAQSSEVRIAGGAVTALSQLTHPRIRALALSLMEIADRRGDAVDLLVSNYEQGDFKMIEAVLREPMKDDDLHHLGMGVRHLLNAHRPDEAEHSLLMLYEKDPCSLCRGDFVEQLISLQRLPDPVREECRYDADPDTRKLVQ